MKIRPVRSFIFFLSFIAVSKSMVMGPTYLPVERLVANTTAHLQNDPNDAGLWYNLARIHYLAFANQALTVGAYVHHSPPRACPDWLLKGDVCGAANQHAWELALKKEGYSSIEEVPDDKRPKIEESVCVIEKALMAEGWRPEAPPREQLLAHATEAKKSFLHAIQLEPKNGLYLLGLASLYRQYLDYSVKEDPNTPAIGFDDVTVAVAREMFYEAFQCAIDEDMEVIYRPMAGIQTLVSYEAGMAFIELGKMQDPLSREIKQKIAKVQVALSKLDKKPNSGVITPIIFSIDSLSSLKDLLEPGLQIEFDLDGDGLSEIWPWIKSDTGLLVWDHIGDGQITSGRQLFGSVTWWVFFENGYCALKALDDNLDGQLAGEELISISVWFDRNSDGKSDSTEVIQVQQLGIASINTEYVIQDGIPYNGEGICFNDGTTIATFDWIASPIVDELTSSVEYER